MFLLFFLLLFTFANAQTPGFIFKPAGNALGKSVLDPNGDGYVSKTSSGFKTTDYDTASELVMVKLPTIGAGVEPLNDLTTGSNGGHTDLASFGGNTNQSCYMLYTKVGGIPYLILRFRLGGASTAAKGYTFLMETDGVFNSTGKNPGFDKEVVFETGSNGRIAVYNLSGDNVTLASSYDVNNYSQRSVAKSTAGGDADYFYDFFIPYSALNLTTYPVRLAAASVTSASSGITGTISDFCGVNDKDYNNDPKAISKAIVSVFPATDLTKLTSGASFSTPKTTRPIVTAGTAVDSTKVRGTSTEADGTVIKVYRRRLSSGKTDFLGDTVVKNNLWSKTVSPSPAFVAGDSLSATALASGKTVSDTSLKVLLVAAKSCYTPCPVITTTSPSGTRTATITWSNGQKIQRNTVEIRVYLVTTAAGVATYTLTPAAYTSQYCDTTRTMTYTLGGNGATNGSWVAKATFKSCVSDYSNTFIVGNSSNGVSTNAPTITLPDTVKENINSQNITIRNQDSSSAYLSIYVNGQLKGTSASAIAKRATTTLPLTGLLVGDTIFARAIGTSANQMLSNRSNIKQVYSASFTRTTAPVITGTYIAGSSKTVTGTSEEIAETSILLYKARTTLLGTTTVNAFGTWSVSGLTLATNDTLTAYARATGKKLSVVSNSKIVQASAPSPPTVTGSYTAGGTSVSGTGGAGTVTVYIDGGPVGTTTGASWSLTGLDSKQLYRGAVIHATNTVSGIESAISNTVTVTGVISFAITNTSGGAIGNQTAGTDFNIKLDGKDAASGGGNTYTAFTGTVSVLCPTSTVVKGGGTSATFSSGILASHTMNLTTAGTHNISAVNTDDPTATGSGSVTIVPAATAKLVLNEPDNVDVNVRAAYTVTRKDQYNNSVTNDNNALTVYLTVNSGAGIFYNAASGGSTITSVTISANSASANFWFQSGTAGTYLVTASETTPANGVTGITDDTDTIGVVGSAAKYDVIVVPKSKTSTAIIVTAQLVDANGNAINATKTVNWSTTNGTLSGSTSTSNSKGLATITLTTSSSAGITHIITAQSDAGAITGQDTTVTQIGIVWIGTYSTDFNTAGNWESNVVPSDGDDIIYHRTPVNPCYLDQNRILNNFFFNGSGQNNTFYLNGNKLTLTGDLEIYGSGRMDAQTVGSKLVLKRGAAKNIADNTFANNLLRDTEIDNASGEQINGNITIAGNIKLTSGSLKLAGKRLTFTGDTITRPGTASIDASASGSVVEFAQSNSGNITLPAGTFTGKVAKIKMNGNANVTLGDDVSVDENIDLTKGDLILGAKKLRLGTAATLLNGSNSSMIVTNNSDVQYGVYKSSTSTNSIVFPVGDGTTMRKVAIVPSSADQTVFRVSSSNTVSNRTSLGTGVDSVSRVHKWDVHQDSGSATAKIRLYWTPSSNVKNPSRAIVAHYTGSTPKWEKELSIYSGTTDSGYVETNAAVSSFSDFTIGESLTPLPVKLIYFNANCDESNIKLKWTTASEINNDYFILERRINDSESLPVATIKGFGNSNQLINYSYTDKDILNNVALNASLFYRLKQVDYNGVFEYSNFIKVNKCQDIIPSEIVLYPNINTGKVYLITNNNLVSNIEIYNSIGNKVYTTDLINANSEITFNLPGGVYYYFITNDKTIVSKGKLIVK